MITSPEEYRKRLQEIQDGTEISFTTLPSSEPRCVIDADSRTITIPEEFKFLGVKTDHKAETIYFEIDRYFDGIDLSRHTCVIQFKTATFEGFYPVTELDVDSVEGKIIFGWTVYNDATQSAGNISFSVRFYSIMYDMFSYNYNTIPASSSILDSLDVSDAGDYINPSVLELWMYRMEQLYETVNQQLNEWTDIKTDAISTTEVLKKTNDRCNASITSANAATANASAEALRAKGLTDSYGANLAAKANQSDLETEKAKLDTAIAALTVDSEIIDTRVGYNGMIHKTAGNAVREQVTDLHDEVNTKAAINDVSGIAFTNSVNGSLITVADSAEWPLVDLTVDGKSEQVKTTGAQLFDASKIPSKTQGGVKLKNNGDGSFTITGSGIFTEYTNFSSFVYTNEETLRLIKPGLYTMNKHSILPYCYFQVYGTGIDKIIRSTNPQSMEITQEDLNIPDVKLHIGFSIQLNAQNVNGTVKPIIWMKGAPPTEADWEPYTGGAPSPSPDYPQPIKSVGDSGKLDLCVVNGNLLDQETVLPAIGFVKQSDGSFCVESSNIPYRKHIWDNTARHNGQITLLYDYKFLNTGDLVGVVFQIRYTDGTIAPATISKTDKWSTSKLVSVSGKIVDCIDCTYGTGVNSTWIRNVVIYFGAIENPVYIPFKGHQISIFLTEPLRGIGDIRDQICRRGDVWGIERKIGEIIEDGNRKYTKYLSGSINGYICFQHRIDDKLIVGKNDLGINTHFPFISSVGSKNEDGFTVIYLMINSYPYIRMKIREEKFADANEFNNWLTEQYSAKTPVKILYQLSAPTWKPFDQITQKKLDSIHTYSTISTIYTLDPLNPDLTIEYVQDPNLVLKQEEAKNKSYTDAKIAEIVALLPTEAQAAIVNNSITNLLGQEI